MRLSRLRPLGARGHLTPRRSGPSPRRHRRRAGGLPRPRARETRIASNGVARVARLLFDGVTTVDDPAPAGRLLTGVEAVIDKDMASALLAIEIGADALAIVTDVDAVYADWGTQQQRAIRSATPAELAASEFAAGSMGPKVRAACWFAEKTGGFAAIGAIDDTAALLRGEAGTRVALDPAEVNAVRTG